jgi:hypothetical protein
VLDYSALTSPVRPEDVQSFVESGKGTGRGWSALAPVRYGPVQALNIVLPLIVLPLLVWAMLVRFDKAELWVLLVLATLVLAGLAIVQLKARSRFAGLSWETMYRMHAFALANHMNYAGNGSGRPSYPGQLFSAGGQAYNRVFSSSGRFFEIGSYARYLGEEGGVPLYAHRGYIAVQLDATLPQITLTALRRHGKRTSVLVGGNGQVVSLEGDFDKHFALRCPPGYERDALYVLTPDLMALLIDESADFDVEIVDDWMFVYSSEPFATADPAAYRLAFRILSTVGVKVVSQSAGYRDHRSGAASRGARLFSGTPLWTVLFSWAVVAALIGLVAAAIAR